MTAVLDIVRTVAPADTPWSLAEAKEHLRIEAGEHSEDFTVQRLVDAATRRLDGYAGILGRCLISQTWKLYLDRFPASSAAIELPLKPLIAVTGITYVDTDGATQTLATTVYQALDGPLSKVALKYDQSWPSCRVTPRSVAVTFTAGWATRAEVPDDIRVAGLMMIGHWYENRETVNVGNIVSSMPLGAEELLAPWRTRMLG